MQGFLLSEYKDATGVSYSWRETEREIEQERARSTERF